MDWSAVDPRVFADELVKNGSVAIPGLGKFVLTLHRGGTATPPGTSEPVEIPPHYRVRFKACRVLRELLQDAYS